MKENAKLRLGEKNGKGNSMKTEVSVSGEG